VKFCLVRELGKLHELLAKLTERLARLGSDWSELAAVAEAWAVMAGGGAACSRRSPVNLAYARPESTRGGTTEALGLLYRHSAGVGARRT
jgi:hypothetical protein